MDLELVPEALERPVRHSHGVFDSVLSYGNRLVCEIDRGRVREFGEVDGNIREIGQGGIVRVCHGHRSVHLRLRESHERVVLDVQGVTHHNSSVFGDFLDVNERYAELKGGAVVVRPDVERGRSLVCHNHNWQWVLKRTIWTVPSLYAIAHSSQAIASAAALWCSGTFDDAWSAIKETRAAVLIRVAYAITAYCFGSCQIRDVRERSSAEIVYCGHAVVVDCVGVESRM